MACPQRSFLPTLNAGGSPTSSVSVVLLGLRDSADSDSDSTMEVSRLRADAGVAGVGACGCEGVYAYFGCVYVFWCVWPMLRQFSGKRNIRI